MNDLRPAKAGRFSIKKSVGATLGRPPLRRSGKCALMHGISRAIKDRPYDLNTVQGYFKYSFKYRPV